MAHDHVAVISGSATSSWRRAPGVRARIGEVTRTDPANPADPRRHPARSGSHSL